MLIIAVLLVAVVLVVLYENVDQDIKESEEIQARKRKEAIALFDMMHKIFDELEDDPLMNLQKWMEWLPIFEYADEVIRRDSGLSFKGIARRVRAEISGKDVADL